MQTKLVAADGSTNQLDYVMRNGPAGWKAVDKYVADNAYVLPLLQYYQPILYKADLKVTPNTSGALQPATLVSKA